MCGSTRGSSATPPTSPTDTYEFDLPRAPNPNEVVAIRFDLSKDDADGILEDNSDNHQDPNIDADLEVNTDTGMNAKADTDLLSFEKALLHEVAKCYTKVE